MYTYTCVVYEIQCVCNVYTCKLYNHLAQLMFNQCSSFDILIRNVYLRTSIYIKTRSKTQILCNTLLIEINSK